MLDVAIIGGGLSGLALAERLHNSGRSFTLFESRQRLGGRILSHANSDSSFHFDLGPSWIWPESQPRIARMVSERGLNIYPQWIAGRSLYQSGRDSAPQAFVDHMTYGPARRIEGGSVQLIEKLAQRLPQENLKLGYQLLAVNDQHDHVELTLRHGASTLCVRAKHLVIALPPRLAAESINFTPSLDERLAHLLSDTPTWMAGHAKALIRYRHAFWRNSGLSGSALAGYPGAILGEIFDASDNDGEYAALAGFFALPAPLRHRYREDLEPLLLAQLFQLFGPEATEPEEIVIQDWFAEPATATLADDPPPTEHPRYGHAWLQMGHWSNKLYFGASETAADFGGYLEGALEAAERVANQLKNLTLQTKEPVMSQTETDDPLIVFSNYVAAQRSAMKRQYDRNVNRDLAQQRPHELLSRNVRDVLNQIYDSTLQWLRTEQIAIAIDIARQPFNGIQDELLAYAVQKHRTSCAISNFPDEHKPSADYIALTLKAAEQDWQNFVLQLTALTENYLPENATNGAVK